MRLVITQSKVELVVPCTAWWYIVNCSVLKFCKWLKYKFLILLHGRLLRTRPTGSIKSLKWIAQWHIIERGSKMRFLVLGVSNEKLIISRSHFNRLQFKLQNNILELHEALAKKLYKCLQNPWKTPRNWGFP